MPTNAEFAYPEQDPELPYPPAITWRRPMAAPVPDDVVLMPPFSRGAMHLPVPTATIAPPAPSPAAAVPALNQAAPLPLAPDPGSALAEEVAGRLESMAHDLRRLGFHALLEPRSEHEPIDAVLAAVIAGFLAHR